MTLALKSSLILTWYGKSDNEQLGKMTTVEFRRLGQCFIDWATAVVGEADRELTCVTLTYHSSGPIYEISPFCIEAMSKYEESILNLLK